MKLRNKETKERWYINENGGVLKYVPSDPDGEDLAYMKYQNEIGNCFDTEEEAEKAVEKLKAWKRLKDAGFKLKGWYMPKNVLNIEIDGGFSDDVSLCDIMDDLDKVFGGEE